MAHYWQSFLNNGAGSATGLGDCPSRRGRSIRGKARQRRIRVIAILLDQFAGTGLGGLGVTRHLCAHRIHHHLHIRRLRKAINIGDRPDIIRTVRSAGYALDAGN